MYGEKREQTIVDGLASKLYVGHDPSLFLDENIVTEHAVELVELKEKSGFHLTK